MKPSPPATSTCRVILLRARVYCDPMLASPRALAARLLRCSYPCEIGQLRMSAALHFETPIVEIVGHALRPVQASACSVAVWLRLLEVRLRGHVLTVACSSCVRLAVAC